MHRYYFLENFLTFFPIIVAWGICNVTLTNFINFLACFPLSLYFSLVENKICLPTRYLFTFSNLFPDNRDWYHTCFLMTLLGNFKNMDDKTIEPAFPCTVVGSLFSCNKNKFTNNEDRKFYWFSTPNVAWKLSDFEKLAHSVILLLLLNFYHELCKPLSPPFNWDPYETDFEQDHHQKNLESFAKHI